MKKEIILKGKGFILRPYKNGDEKSIVENANNKKVAKNMLDSFPSPYTVKDAKEWINSNLELYKKYKFPFTFAIDVNGKVAGAIGGGTPKNNNKTMGFGYWLGEKYWGKGIMSEAVKLFTDYLFKNLKLVRVAATTYTWNQASQKVLEKNHFKLEGILRKSTIKNNKLIDLYQYSKLRNLSRYK